MVWIAGIILFHEMYLPGNQPLRYGNGMKAETYISFEFNLLDAPIHDLLSSCRRMIESSPTFYIVLCLHFLSLSLVLLHTHTHTYSWYAWFLAICSPLVCELIIPIQTWPFHFYAECSRSCLAKVNTNRVMGEKYIKECCKTNFSIAIPRTNMNTHTHTQRMYTYFEWILLTTNFSKNLFSPIASCYWVCFGGKNMYLNRNQIIIITKTVHRMMNIWSMDSIPEISTDFKIFVLYLQNQTLVMNASYMHHMWNVQYAHLKVSHSLIRSLRRCARFRIHSN